MSLLRICLRETNLEDFGRYWSNIFLKSTNSLKSWQILIRLPALSREVVEFMFFRNSLRRDGRGTECPATVPRCPAMCFIETVFAGH